MKKQLIEILKMHALWLHDDPAGKKANLKGADLKGVDMRWTKLERANLKGADLRRADLRWTDLTNADLRETDLRETDLRWVDLTGVDLRKADLRWTDLRWANLRGADLRGATGVIIGPQRTDGYQFFLSQRDDASWHVVTGCRQMTIAAYQQHIKTYDDPAKQIETAKILDYLEGRLVGLSEVQE